MDTLECPRFGVYDRIENLEYLKGYEVPRYSLGMIVGVSDEVPECYFAQFDCKPNVRVVVWQREIRLVNPTGRLKVRWDHSLWKPTV